MRSACSCWIWCTLWGAAFVLREKDEVRFDIIYSASSEQHAPRLHDHHRHRGHRAVRHRAARRHRYVTFLKVERSAYLGIRLDYLYSIYVVFSVAVDRPLCAL